MLADTHLLRERRSFSSIASQTVARALDRRCTDTI
jgi:hypothetical protein